MIATSQTPTLGVYNAGLWQYIQSSSDCSVVLRNTDGNNFTLFLAARTPITVSFSGVVSTTAAGGANDLLVGRLK